MNADWSERIVTMDGMRQALKQAAKLGAIGEKGINAVEARVPFWRINRTRKELRERLPITIALQVKRLSLIEHFTTKGIINL